MNRAIDYARSQRDAGGVWLDQSINPAASEERDVGEYVWSSADERTGTIEIGVVDDGLQERLDGRYGEGMVEVHAELKPVR